LAVQLLFNLVHPGTVFYEGEEETKDIEMAKVYKTKSKYTTRQ